MISLFKENKPIPLDRYFQLVKPKYTYIKITPHKSNRNNKSDNIAKAVTHTFKTLDKQIRIEQKKIWIETSFKISYIIDIQGGNANFYFLVPEVFESILLEKIAEIWSKATVEKVESIKPFNLNSTNYQLCYKNEDALSLMVNKASNEPLNSILSVMEIMKGEDRVTLIYNFIPRSQFGWLKQYDDTMVKIKENKPIEREKLSLKYISKYTLSALSSLFDVLAEILCDLMGGNRKVSTQTFSDSLAQALQQNKVITEHTKAKKTQRVLECQIAVTSNSQDKTREDNNAVSVCQAFRVLDGDNELIYKKSKPIEDITEFKLNGYEVNTISTDEAQNFIQQPARNLLRQFGIKHIQTEENPVPNQLQNGYMNLGSVSTKGKVVETFLEDDYNIGSLPLAINGSQGAGKSTFIANIYRFAESRGEGGLLIDYIKNNELTLEVTKYIDKDNLIVLDYSNENLMQGFAFNEVLNLKENRPFNIVKIANLQSQQVISLVNAINDDSQPLQARMRKYLNAAATVVFSVGETSLREVIECLQNHNIRHNYIKLISDELKPFLVSKIMELQELDEWSKITKDNPVSEIIGTKSDRIDGILDRISLLKEDVALEYMFNKGAVDNIDLAKEIEDGKVIIIKMLQDDWSARSKDIITTFFISKLWLATEIRGRWNNQPKRSYNIVDEIFQCPTAMKMLSDKNILPQCRKFGAKFCFSTQGLGQLKDLLTSIIDAGGSFMFLKGTKEEDFNLLKNKIDGYEYEDVRDMAKTYDYPSLNLVYYSGGYASFISKLPEPLYV